MNMEIKVPSLPESVSDATLVAWHKKPGDAVSRDENLVDLETDKIVLEVPSPASGTLKEIKIEDGATVKAGDLIAILEEGGKGGNGKQKDNGGRQAAAQEEEPSREAEAAARDEQTGAAAQEADAEAAEEEEPARDRDDSKRRAESAHDKLSPSVRRLLEEHDLDADAVSGSGRDGRITKSDVMDYLKRHDESEGRDETERPATEPAEGGRARNDRRVPMTRLRARIAERLVEAQQTAAMLTTFNEVDLSRVIDLRNRYKQPFEKEHGVKLGYMSFFAKAAVEALKKFPAVNASVEGKDIIYHDYFDIGIAVSSERGLMVPVVRDVDRLSFAEIEKTVDRLGKKVREGSIGMDDLTGGTFTITNGGIFGSMLSTPILNPPQSAILGMHAIQERPMAVDGAVAVRPMMYVALTYDHRIIDGREAVQFLVSIKQSLEDPGRLLLQF
ncbi:MAG TPA: 2-oxoglutarate dehydrogenase complex dihydrolipoyllysine-residue succinyltransferase [Woeseiaceae bacterium]|nr:2-oxoglutarate dehydrogenase complex dihydrolipoyllysine-residue succinyltransferase [Woeseiaceae bacterium]